MPHYKEKSHQHVSAHQAAAHQGPLESQQAASHVAHQAINHQDILESQGVAAYQAAAFKATVAAYQAPVHQATLE